jgi:uridine kinase
LTVFITRGSSATGRASISAIGYYEDAFDYQRIVRLLLEPLSGNAFPAECRLDGFDLRTNMPLDAPPVAASARSVLLFDGIFVFRRELNRYWDYRILVEVDAETALARALSRTHTLIRTPGVET